MSKTNDYSFIANALAQFFDHKKELRDDYLNQPLVQVYDQDQDTMVYKRRSEAVGLPTEKKIDYGKEFGSYLDLMEEAYPDAKIMEQDFVLGMIDEVDTENDYADATSRLDSYLKGKFPDKTTSDDDELFNTTNRLYINKLYQTDQNIVGIKNNLFNIGGDYLKSLKDAGILEYDSDEYNSLLDSYTAGKFPEGKYDPVILFSLFGYVPSSDKDLNQESLDAAVKRAERHYTDFESAQNLLSADFRGSTKIDPFKAK